MSFLLLIVASWLLIFGAGWILTGSPRAATRTACVWIGAIACIMVPAAIIGALMGLV